MNSPYKGKFRVSQIFKGASHDGLDLVGVDSKEVHSTVSGTVEKAAWENPLNRKQGFGLYVRIKAAESVDKYYYGHLSKVTVTAGQTVKKGDLIGVEGSTGNSTGPHLHFAIFTGSSNDPWGYASSGGSNKISYNGCVFYNPSYVISNGKLP